MDKENNNNNKNHFILELRGIKQKPGLGTSVGWSRGCDEALLCAAVRSNQTGGLGALYVGRLPSKASVFRF